MAYGLKVSSCEPLKVFHLINIQNFKVFVHRNFSILYQDFNHDAMKTFLEYSNDDYNDLLSVDEFPVPLQFVVL